MNDSPDLEHITLENSYHETREEGVCIMELVAWMAGEKHTALPECCSHVLAGMAMEINDTLGDEERQKLIPIAQELAGTNCPGCEAERAAAAILHSLRGAVADALSRHGMENAAQQARKTPPHEHQAQDLALNAIREICREECGQTHDVWGPLDNLLEANTSFQDMQLEDAAAYATAATLSAAENPAEAAIANLREAIGTCPHQTGADQ